MYSKVSGSVAFLSQGWMLCGIGLPSVGRDLLLLWSLGVVGSLLTCMAFSIGLCRRLLRWRNWLREDLGARLDSGNIFGVSLRGFGTSQIFYVKVNSYPEVTFVVVSVCQQRQVCTVQAVQGCAWL